MQGVAKSLCKIEFKVNVHCTSQLCTRSLGTNEHTQTMGRRKDHGPHVNPLDNIRGLLYQKQCSGNSFNLRCHLSLCVPILQLLPEKSHQEGPDPVPAAVGCKLQMLSWQTLAPASSEQPPASASLAEKESYSLAGQLSGDAPPCRRFFYAL